MFGVVVNNTETTSHKEKQNGKCYSRMNCTALLRFALFHLCCSRYIAVLSVRQFQSIIIDEKQNLSCKLFLKHARKNNPPDRLTNYYKGVTID